MDESLNYIEFVVDDAERFALLRRFFDEFKKSKSADSYEEDEFYLGFFDEKARSYFGWYSKEEDLEWSKKWFATPLEQRWNNPDLNRKWDFGSMIDSIKSGEYELVSCEMTTNNKAKIIFEPWAYPFGGTGCLKALIESFGFEITEEKYL